MQTLDSNQRGNLSLLFNECEGVGENRSEATVGPSSFLLCQFGHVWPGGDWCWGSGGSLKTQELSSGCFLHRREGNIVIHSQIWIIPALIILSSHFSRPLLPSDEFLGSVSLVGGIPQVWPPLALSTLSFQLDQAYPRSHGSGLALSLAYAPPS